MDGLLLVDKPQGITSHDAVVRARKALGTRRIGHAGTLDPMATGLLILLVGKCTKLFDAFMAYDKAYRSTMVLGAFSDTGDAEGKIISRHGLEGVSPDDIHAVCENFRGEILQQPPMYSALKLNGKKLYEYARQGIAVEREPRPVHVRILNIEKIMLPQVEFYTECSKGTYVRQLAEDMGRALGCGAYLSALRRVKIGPFHVDEAVQIEGINESCLRHWPV